MALRITQMALAALCFLIGHSEAGGIQIYIRKWKTFHTLYVATEEDRKNPDYTDPCMGNNNDEICTYCCLITLGGGSCSRNALICEKQYDRNFEQLSIMIGFILAAVIGCRIVAIFLKCCL
jgi:hypothetical protein